MFKGRLRSQKFKKATIMHVQKKLPFSRSSGKYLSGIYSETLFMKSKLVLFAKLV
jgi:hypothetical protein